MELGGENEVGVWVSGFYGSGKSSFTKYLGLALDTNVQIDGLPFLRYLQDRLQKPQTRALLSTVAQRFPAAVLLLDLASEQVAGATMEEVATVLYYKVLQWAGYSRNLKVAAFERRLKKDGRSEEFHDLFRAQTGEEWQNYQNDELVVDSLIPDLAHQMYPTLFKTPTAFTTATSDFIYLLDDRVQPERRKATARPPARPRYVRRLGRRAHAARRHEAFRSVPGPRDEEDLLGAGERRAAQA